MSASKKDLYPIARSISSKDLSPKVSQYLDEINKLRKQPKLKGEDSDAEGKDRPAITDTDLISFRGRVWRKVNPDSVIQRDMVGSNAK